MNNEGYYYYENVYDACMCVDVFNLIFIYFPPQANVNGRRMSNGLL